MRIGYLKIFIFLFCINTTIVGQESVIWPYQHIDKKSGLANSSINAIYMDKQDFVWFGSWDGLARYDGSNIRQFKYDPFIKGTISNNVVRDIIEDNEAKLWVVTHLGINRYNSDNDSFKVYFDKINIPFKEYNLKACIGPDSLMWVAINGWGVGRYVKKEDKFIPVKFQYPDSIWLKSVIGIGSFNHRLFILGDNGKFICLQNNKIEYTFWVNKQNLLRQSKFLFINKKYYLAVPLEHNGLLLYNISQKRVFPYQLVFGTSKITSLSENTGSNIIWAGTESGSIFKITNNRNGFEVLSMESYMPILSQKKLKILSITDTRQNILWIGTDGDGIYKFHTIERPFSSIINGNTQQGQLSNSVVRSVCENSGKLYIGTRGGGLNIIDIKSRKNIVLNTSSGLSNNTVLSINKDHKGNIWLGVDGDGVEMIESRTNHVYHFPADFQIKYNIHFGSVNSIYIDSIDNIWLGTSGYGVIRFQTEKKAYRKYYLKNFERIDAANKVIKSNIINSIIEEKPNLLWFGARSGGLYKYNTAHKKFEEIIRTDSKPTFLGNNDVLSLFKDSENNLWIGTSEGLNCLNLNSKPYKMTWYTEYDGLPNNTIHGILSDSHGNIWLSTNNGLSLLNIKDKTFQNFDWNDGMENNEFTDGAAFKSPGSNNLYFGGIDGLDIVNPAKIDSSSYFPRLALTGFEVQNAIIIPGGKNRILKQHIDITNDIILKYNENFLNFHFTALDYWNKQRYKYAFYFENLNKDWIYINKQNSINLTNIPPGKYILKIKYVNENKSWITKSRIINITIKPPFWARIWFRAIVIILIIVTLIRFYYNRVNNIKRKNIELETLVSEKTQELYGINASLEERQEEIETQNERIVKQNDQLEKYSNDLENRVQVRTYELELAKIKAEESDQLKSSFLANMSHEIRTPLNAIVGFSNILAQNNLTVQEKQEAIKTINNNTDAILVLINDILDLSLIEANQLKLNNSLFPVNDLLNELLNYWSLCLNPNENVSVRLTDVENIKKLSLFSDKFRVNQILSNLISNAIKYTERGSIEFGCKIKDNEAIFHVRDTGIGISEENIHKLFKRFSKIEDNNKLYRGAGLGLVISKHLAELLHGKIWVESKLGKGSTFFLSVPIIEPSVNDIDIPNMSKKLQNLDWKSKSILVVEDEDSNFKYIKVMLKKTNVTLVWAQNGLEAFQKFKSFQKFDLVLMDIKMPVMDGFTALKMIREIYPFQVIIAQTAYVMVEDVNRINEAGFNDYISKPFTPEVLLKKLSKYL